MADQPEPKHIAAEMLDDRQIRGVQRAKAADRSNGLVIVVNDSTSFWMSKSGNRAWKVDREQRNRGGTLQVEYHCACGDHDKNPRLDCEHIFAEKLRRGEVIVDGAIEPRRAQSAKAAVCLRENASRQSGAPCVRSSVMPASRWATESPKCCASWLVRWRSIVNKFKRRYVMKAFALIFKIALGNSNDEMQSVYATLIETGVLRLRKVPHQNTLSRWMNDERLTPILEKILELTARVFRAVECAGIVDSSKMSQMRSAHSRWVEYGDDQRDDADWMKMHALVGVETLVCMAVMFSGSRGAGTHDINFILPLVERVRGVFDLRFILADKAYLSEKVVGRLWQMGMQAVIPIKKRWDGKNMKQFYESYQHLVRWYDDRQADFHLMYRLRPKIESFFSLVKRVSSGFCWSRGRPRKGADGKLHYGGNADGPCTAWKNETLCKMIYVNLRLIVQYEIATGYRMNFLTDTFFPSIPDADKLIA